MSASPSMAPLEGFARAVAAVSVALGTFMQVLDGTIANVALPTIAGDLGVSPSQGLWVITTFAVANAVSVPLTGWLMGRYGVVRTYTVSVLLFTLASLLCGLAWNLGSLITFRVLQGMSSGPLVPGSQVLLTSIFPPQQRGTALTIWIMTALIAPVCGPLLGGFICDNWAWPWIFLVNLPIGLACAAGCWRYLATRETPTRKLPVDRVGFALLFTWVGALQVLLDQGKDADWFSSPVIVVLAVVAALGFATFVIWELTDPHPIVDLLLFRRPAFSLGVLSFSLSYALYLANALLLPLWLQTHLGYTATWAGLVLVPTGIVPLILAIPGTKLMERVGLRWGATVSLLAMALAFHARAALTPAASFQDILVPTAISGVGTTVFFSSMMTLALEGLSQPQMPSGAGLLNFSRMTAAAFAVSLVNTLWDRREAFHQTHLAENATLFSPLWRQAVEQLQANGLGLQQSAAALYRPLLDQAYALAFIDVSWLSAWITLLLVPLMWTARKRAAS